MTTTNKTSEGVLGIDIGRVIIAPSDGSGDTSFLNGDEAEAMRTPQNQGAFEAIGRLAEGFEGRVWIVSKCGPRIAERSRRWLAHHEFHRRTGIGADRLRFCRQRHEKRGHCEALGITHFVDDRIDVHGHLRGLVPHLYLFGPQKPNRPIPRWVVHTLTWPLAEAAIAATLPGRRHDHAS